MKKKLLSLSTIFLFITSSNFLIFIVQSQNQRLITNKKKEIDYEINRTDLTSKIKELNNKIKKLETIVIKFQKIIKQNNENLKKITNLQREISVINLQIINLKKEVAQLKLKIKNLENDLSEGNRSFLKFVESSIRFFFSQNHDLGITSKTKGYEIMSKIKEKFENNLRVKADLLNLIKIDIDWSIKNYNENSFTSNISLIISIKLNGKELSDFGNSKKIFLHLINIAK